MLLYLGTFTNLTLNHMQKYVFCLFFKNCPTIGNRDGGTYLNLGNKIQKSLEEVTSITKYQLYALINQLALLLFLK